MRAQVIVTLLLFVHVDTFVQPSIIKITQSQEAYATLLYGEPYVLGVRVLGQSLRESGTTKDMVALVTGPVSAAAEMTLMMDGWKVQRVHPVVNPGKGPQGSHGAPARFWAVYTKLLIFQMTEYRKVIFLDADILVIKNMDVLFGCPGFCAALRHSERFNSGVMSLVPSQEMFDDMMAHINAMPSYTGGDQGFLNAYFAGFAKSLLFDPAISYRSDEHKFMRLPTVFNADIGLYVVANRWMIPRETLHCIHFTLGNLKPWIWYTSWLVGETDTWQGYRSRLPADSNGVQNGRTFRQRFAETWLLVLPPALVAYLVWRALTKRRVLQWSSSAYSHLGKHSGGKGGGPHSAPWLSSNWGAPSFGGSGGGGAGFSINVTDSHPHGSSSGGGHGHGHGGAAVAAAGVGLRSSGALFLAAAAAVRDCVPGMFTVLSLAAGYLSILVALLCTLIIVPPEVAPVFGWILSYEWGLLIFTACYSGYLYLCLLWGREANLSNGGSSSSALVSSPHAKHVPKPWAETIFAAATFLAFALLAPWTGFMLGLRAPIARTLVTVAVAVVGNLGLTVQFLVLPSHWFNVGRLEWARYD